MATSSAIPSSVEAFARALNADTKPGDAIHQALEGIDPHRLAVFSKELSSRMRPGQAMTGDAFADALRRSGNGQGRQENETFARHIKAAFAAGADMFGAEMSSAADRAKLAGVPAADEAKLAGVRNTVNHGVDLYVQSLEHSAPALQHRHGNRRPFNKAKIIEAQDVANGTATASEVRDVQRQLNEKGDHLKVDGIAGSLTKAALTKSGLLRP